MQSGNEANHQGLRNKETEQLVWSSSQTLSILDTWCSICIAARPQILLMQSIHFVYTFVYAEHTIQDTEVEHAENTVH